MRNIDNEPKFQLKTQERFLQPVVEGVVSIKRAAHQMKNALEDLQPLAANELTAEVLEGLISFSGIIAARMNEAYVELAKELHHSKQPAQA